MSVEPQAALSVRVSAKTKRYLDALADKKGIGVGKVLDQIVAELEDAPTDTYLAQHAVRYGYMNAFFLRMLLNRTGHMKDMEANILSVRTYLDELFGPLPPAPERFKNPDMTGRPDQVTAMYAAFGLLDPERVPPAVTPPTPRAE